MAGYEKVEAEHIVSYWFSAYYNPKLQCKTRLPRPRKTQAI